VCNRPSFPFYTIFFHPVFIHQGSGVSSSRIIRGMVFRRETEGEVKEVRNCKVAVFSCPVDALQTETKGTVLLTTADELTQFNKGEENLMEKSLSAALRADGW
ncbi:hypothetical protein AHF37_00053, partial [Paragonimus kellicotti]